MYIRNLIIITIFYIIYIEYCIGGILIRIDSNNDKIINLSSLISFMLNPLKNKFLWNSKLIDVNYIFIILIYTIYYSLC